MSRSIPGIKAKSAWGTGFFRLTLHVICGKCNGLFKTKDVVRANNMDNRLTAQCPDCRSWNVTDIIPG